MGIAVGAVYSVYGLILFAIRGGEPFTRVGVTLPGLMVAYLISGAIGGGLLGVLQPLTRNFLGFLVVAVLAALVAVVGVAMSMNGFVTHWSGEDWMAAVISAIMLGSITAFLSGKSRPSKNPFE